MRQMAVGIPVLPTHTRARTALLVAFAVMIAVGYHLAFASVDPLTPDSRGYIYFTPDRSIGYQIFLWLLGHLSTDFSAAALAQLLIVCAAVLLTALAFRRLSGSWLGGAVMLLLSLGYPAPMKATAQVAPESLSMACGALLAALIFAMATGVRRWQILALSALLFGAATLRPTNLGFLPAALVALWLFGHGVHWRSSGLLVAATLLGISATPLAYRVIAPGRPADSPAVRGLFGAALLAPGPAGAEAIACGAPDLDPMLIPIKAHIANAPGAIRGFLELNYVNHLRFRRIIPQIMVEHRLRLRAEANPAMRCYAWVRMRQQPGYFVARALRNYWALITYRNFDRPGFATEVQAYLAAKPAPLPAPISFPDAPEAGLRKTAHWPGSTQATGASQPDREDPFAVAPPRNALLSGLLSAALFAGATISLLALAAVLFPRWRTPVVAGAAACGAAIHSVLLVSSAFEIPVFRYVYPLWPLLAGVLIWPAAALLSQPRRLA